MRGEEGSLTLGSKRFQEETSRREHKIRMARVINSFVDSFTGLLKTEYVAERNCPCCDRTPGESRTIFVKDGFPYRKCSNCSVVYVSPIVKEEILRRMYEELDYAESWMKVLLNPIEQKFNQSKFVRGMYEIEQVVGRKGSLLDVGCAVGQFLKIAKAAGWKVVGLELNRREQEYCRMMGFEIITEPLSDDSFPPETFEAVTLWEVLEHVVDPRNVLQNVYRILKPDGVVLILVPNVDSLAARMLQEKCNMFGGMSHITMFNNMTLGNLLEDEKFTVIGSTTVISEISIMNNYLNYEHPYYGEQHNLHHLFNVINENYVHNNLLGYKLRIIARKRSF